MTGKSFTGGTSGSVNFVYDAASQGIASSDSTSGTVYEDRWYRMGGVNMWHYSNRYNLAAGDASIVGSRYTVKGGDTLQSVALTLWGDGSLWYKLAEANGLSAGAALSEGQSLIVPSGVWRNSQNAATYTPYDAGRFIGPVDASPSYPAPPKSAKCGVFGQILSTLVAIAASQFLGPVFGNLVSQGFNMVIGIQSKFSWKSLGMSVASAVVTAGMSGAFAGVQSAFLQGALQTATASALTQGIGVATGLQKKFDFAGIAAAGVAGGVTSAIGARLGGRTSNVDKTVWSNGDLSKNNAFLANSAGAIAEAATRSAIKGNSFGDNLLASLPSVIGRAALDGAGAKSILGDGWLGTALADPGSVLPKGWITNAANSAISTVGNVVADMVRGNAQGGGGGFNSLMRLTGSPKGSGKFSVLFASLASDSLFGPEASLGNFKRQDPHYPTEQYGRTSKTMSVYRNGKLVSVPNPNYDDPRANVDAPVRKAFIKPKSKVTDVSRDQIEAKERAKTAQLNEEQRIKSAMPAEIELAGDYVDIDSSLLGAINFDPIGPSLVDLAGPKQTYLTNVSDAGPFGIYRSYANLTGNINVRGNEAQGLWDQGVGNIYNRETNIVRFAGKFGLGLLQATGSTFDAFLSPVTGTIDTFAAGGGVPTPGDKMRTNQFVFIAGLAATVLGKLPNPTAVAAESNVARGLRGTSVVSPARAESFLVKNGFSPADAKDFIGSFEGSITARIVRPGEDFLRYTGNPTSAGSFLTKSRFGNPASAVDGLYLSPYGNPATYVQTVTSSGRSIVLEGAIKNGGNGVGQTIIHNRGAFTFGVGQGF